MVEKQIGTFDVIDPNGKTLHPLIMARSSAKIKMPIIKPPTP